MPPPEPTSPPSLLELKVDIEVVLGLGGLILALLLCALRVVCFGYRVPCTSVTVAFVRLKEEEEQQPQRRPQYEKEAEWNGGRVADSPPDVSPLPFTPIKGDGLSNGSPPTGTTGAHYTPPADHRWPVDYQQSVGGNRRYHPRESAGGTPPSMFSTPRPSSRSASNSPEGRGGSISPRMKFHG